jgi:outer membrane protein TolC
VHVPVFSRRPRGSLPFAFLLIDAPRIGRGVTSEAVMFRGFVSLPSILLIGALGTPPAADARTAHGAGARAALSPRGDQPPGAAIGPPLTLDAALSEALANNPELILLRRQFEAARKRPAQERSLAPPTLEAQIWQWPIGTLNPARTNMYMFMVGQDVPGRGKRRLREAVALKDAELAEADIAVRARDVIDRVKRAYADLFLARKAIEVHHASVDLLRQLADVAQAKYATGRISQQDVLKAVVELSRIHDHLITLDEQGRLAEARLNTLLDRPPGAPVGPLAPPHERVLVPPVEALQRLAVEHQPELAVARLGVERAEAQGAVVDREYKPDFFVMGGYMLMPRDRDAWMAKVGVTWPRAPWSRGRLDARRAEATADIAAAHARVRAVESALRLAVQEAYVRVKAAEQRAALLRTTVVPQSEQTLEVSRVAYQTDRVDFLAIIDNERVRLDAQLDYYGALSDLEQALADLERAVGADITPSMFTTVPAPGVH